MKSIIALAALVSLAGCASLDHAGTASYSVKPFVTDKGEVHCCEVTVTNGKEIASLDAHIEKKGADYTIDLKERGVVAFRGQEIAAGAAHEAAKLATTAALVAGGVLAAPALVPVVGAAMAAGTLPAAAVGAAVGAGTAKAAQP